MYSHCLFCRAPFGRNDIIEHLDVGRRIAFDAARGRLWVVCRDCARWNLTPFEDRWEPIEECEEAFRNTQVRSSSENIGLARMRDGLLLIRIGRPLATEFAAWRYGLQLQRRARSMVRRVVARTAPAALLGTAPALALAFGPLAPLAYAGGAALLVAHLLRRPAVRIPFEDGVDLRLTLQHLQQVALLQDRTIPEGWSVSLPHLVEPDRIRRVALRRNYGSEDVVLVGKEARVAAALILPHTNPLGGNLATVTDAVRWLEAVGGPDRAFGTVSRSGRVRPALASGSHTLVTMHAEVRLALEMSLHEEEERRALAGELSVLEWAWRREERIAAIADRLGLDDALTDQLAGLGERAV